MNVRDLLIVVLILIARPALAGVCLSQLRYVSSDEFIDSAVVSVSHNRRVSLNFDQSEAKEYISNNMGCCGFAQDVAPFAFTSILSRLLGTGSRVVRVVMPLKEPGEDTEYLAYVVLDRCGAAVDVIGTTQ